jgi:predicted nucleotidyltransferase
MIDLRTEHQTIVKDILRQYLPDYEILAFGSRVTGRAKQYSDLDLAVISNTPLDFGLLGTVRDAFSESDLPFKVDLVDWATTNQKFREIIKQACEVVQKNQMPEE